MKEIGGYIEFEYFHGKEYHENAIKLNCGRNCLAYLIEAYKIEKIYLPYFLCSSVKNVCEKYSVDICFYYINEDFSPILPKDIEQDDWLYVVNYYGQLRESTILDIKSNIKNIILDNSQAFFSQPIDDISTIYTCRKYFGVSDGAYLYTSQKSSKIYPQDMSYERMHYLLGRFERTASEFYSESVANNKMFATEPIKYMSKLTNNILHGIDYDYVNQRRTDNFILYNKELSKFNKLSLREVKGAFAYPFLIDKGIDIRKQLQKLNIYIPILWPDMQNEMRKNSKELFMAYNILPLPCDQRYNKDDINNIIYEVKRCMEI